MDRAHVQHGGRNAFSATANLAVEDTQIAPRLRERLIAEISFIDWTFFRSRAKMKSFERAPRLSALFLDRITP